MDDLKLLSGSKIIIVDDNTTNITIIEKMIHSRTDYVCLKAENGYVAMDLIKKELPDLILLDIMMPEIDGYEIAQILKNDEETKDIPIIFITAITDLSDKVKAFEFGAVDYITKPFRMEELIARINTHLKLKHLKDEMAEKNRMLEEREYHLNQLVQEKTKKIEGLTFALVNALENANLLNDEDTGNHIIRVSGYAAILAESYGLSLDMVKKIRLYASLHDVGKVGIPDNILKKEGLYTPEEYDIMKKHVEIGYNMLNNKDVDEVVKNIILYHHEKWDGSGYLKGLSKEQIPIEARIVTLADVFDALTTKRVYKPAFDNKKAFSIIQEEKGKHFDPAIVDLFFHDIEKILLIQKKYSTE